MRYNHRYHQHARGRRHRRRKLGTLGLLVAAILIMVTVYHTPIASPSFFMGFGLSLYRVTLAYLWSLILALILGLLTVSRPALENLLLPILDLAQSLPTFALLPILVFYFGRTSASVIAILVVAMVWPIVFAVISGVKDQRQDQAEAAQIFGATGLKFLWHYRLPMLMPSLVTGSIVSWGQAWDTIVGAEIIAKVVGAGAYLGALGEQGQTHLLLVGIITYLFFIFAINQLVWLPLLHRFTKYQAES